MKNATEVEQLTSAMNLIYDADRDYEMCFADLEEEDQKEYKRLKSERDALLAES